MFSVPSPATVGLVLGQLCYNCRVPSVVADIPCDDVPRCHRSFIEDCDDWDIALEVIRVRAMPLFLRIHERLTVRPNQGLPPHEQSPSRTLAWVQAMSIPPRSLDGITIEFPIRRTGKLPILSVYGATRRWERLCDSPQLLNYSMAEALEMNLTYGEDGCLTHESAKYLTTVPFNVPGTTYSAGSPGMAGSRYGGPARPTPFAVTRPCPTKLSYEVLGTTAAERDAALQWVDMFQPRVYGFTCSIELPMQWVVDYRATAPVDVARRIAALERFQHALQDFVIPSEWTADPVVFALQVARTCTTDWGELGIYPEITSPGYGPVVTCEAANAAVPPVLECTPVVAHNPPKSGIVEVTPDDGQCAGTLPRLVVDLDDLAQTRGHMPGFPLMSMIGACSKEDCARNVIDLSTYEPLPFVGTVSNIDITRAQLVSEGTASWHEAVCLDAVLYVLLIADGVVTVKDAPPRLFEVARRPALQVYRSFFEGGPFHYETDAVTTRVCVKGPGPFLVTEARTAISHIVSREHVRDSLQQYASSVRRKDTTTPELFRKGERIKLWDVLPESVYDHGVDLGLWSEQGEGGRGKYVAPQSVREAYAVCRQGQTEWRPIVRANQERLLDAAQQRWGWIFTAPLRLQDGFSFPSGEFNAWLVTSLEEYKAAHEFLTEPPYVNGTTEAEDPAPFSVVNAWGVEGPTSDRPGAIGVIATCVVARGEAFVFHWPSFGWTPPVSAWEIFEHPAVYASTEDANWVLTRWGWGDNITEWHSVMADTPSAGLALVVAEARRGFNVRYSPCGALSDWRVPDQAMADDMAATAALQLMVWTARAVDYPGF